MLLRFTGRHRMLCSSGDATQLRLCGMGVGALVPRQRVEALVGAVNRQCPGMAAGEEATTLWICNRMAGAMGGTMEMVSTGPGPDPAFTVSLELPCRWHPSVSGKTSMSSLNLGLILSHSAHSLGCSNSPSWGSPGVPRCPPKEAPQLLSGGEDVGMTPRATQGSVATGQPQEPPSSTNAPLCRSPSPGSAPTKPSLSPVPSAFLNLKAVVRTVEGLCSRSLSHLSLGRAATPERTAGEADTLSWASAATAEAAPERDAPSPEPGAGADPAVDVDPPCPPRPAARAHRPARGGDGEARVAGLGLRQAHLLSGKESVTPAAAPLRPADGPSSPGHQSRGEPSMERSCTLVSVFQPQSRQPPGGEDAVCHSQSAPTALALRAPRARAASPGAGDRPRADPSPYPEDVAFLSRTQPELLFVSGDLASMKGMRAACRALGIAVVYFAASATTALETFQRHPGIAAVVLDQGDQRLPQRMELAHRLRQLAPDRRLLIVALVQVLDGGLLRRLSEWPPSLVDQWLSSPLRARRMGQIMRAFFAADAGLAPVPGMRDPLEALLLTSLPHRPYSDRAPRPLGQTDLAADVPPWQATKG